MELRQYAAVLWKWSWLIVLATLVAGVSSWLAVRDQPAVYQTSTTLMIGQAIEKADPNYQDFYTSERLAQTYSELIKREPILRRTAAALGFEDQWRALSGQVAVSLIAGTQLMEIRVTDTDPVRAQLIADEIAQQLLAQVEATRPQDSNRRFIEEQAASFPPKIQAAQEEIQSLEAELANAFSARQIQDIQSNINTLQSQINTWQNTYAQYQLLLGDTGTNVLTIIETASQPVQVGPQWMMQVLLAAAIGGILAVGAAFLIEYLDDTLKTPEDVTRVTGLTTVGAISRIDGSAPADKLVTARHPKSPISEAYRVMRTNLQFSSLDRPLHSLVVTSPQPTEGKTTTVANLGVVMAQSGKRVILVDSDLRRPSLHKHFGVSNQDGLTSVLLEDEPMLNGRLQSTGVDNLQILTSGPLPPNPSELLGSQRMQHLLEQLLEHADVVLFDTPPSLPVTDAAVLSTQTDGVLVVTDSGRTRRNTARETVERLQAVGANTLGVALNRLKPGRGGAYYYYYYEYRYGNGKTRRQSGGLRRFLPWLRKK
jgi:non-specific protein-tyrosine kinase